MSFCPKCKNEYREGVLICPDCNCALVQSLANYAGEIDPPVLYIKSEGVKKRFLDYLSYSGIKTRVSQNPEDGRYEIYCDKDETDRVKRAFSVFVAVEAGNVMAARNNQKLEAATTIDDIDDIENFSIPEDWEEALVEEADEDEDISDLLEEDAVIDLTTPAFMHGASKPTAYVSAADKQKDTRETGFTLIIMGLLLAALNVYLIKSNRLNGFASGVIFGLTLIMVVYGIYCIFKSKSLKKAADSENEQSKHVSEYLKEHFTKEAIESAVASSDAEGPELDLLRQQYLSDGIREAFPDVDDTLLQYLADEWYQELFEAE